MTSAASDIPGTYLRSWGNGDKTALLIHGLGNSSLSWYKLAPLLAERGFRVHALDLHGHGRSARREKYSIKDWVEQVCALGIESVDLLVGHSLGGLVAVYAEEQMKVQQTILLDPLIRFPRSRFVAWGTRGIFARWMQSTLTFRRASKEWTQRETHVLYSDLRKWDIRSTQALHNGAAALRRFLDIKGHLVVFRAEKSYVTPKHVEHHVPKEGAVFETLRLGHNMHIEAGDKILNSIVNLTPPAASIL